VSLQQSNQGQYACQANCSLNFFRFSGFLGEVLQQKVNQKWYFIFLKFKPPKKQVIEKPLLGRPGNNLKMGIVGLPNVGKSSFFNSLTNSSVPSENFPFCTIDPSESRVQVPDPRFDWLVDFYKPKSVVGAFLTVIDIAGLVKGAAEGEGLGNAFLSHIKAVDGIFHLCRAFDDADIVHVEGEIDPLRDLKIIHEELRLKDAEFIDKLVLANKRDVERMGKVSSSPLTLGRRCFCKRKEGTIRNFAESSKMGL
jgi:GTP-binding protein YchF